MFFRGISRLSVDAKGRFALPKQRRERLAASGVTSLVVTADAARCLLLYPQPEWQRIEPQIAGMPNAHPAARHYQRLYLGYATDIELDGSGRVLLTNELREYADIDRQVVLIGQGRKLELWSAKRFDEQSDIWANQIAELAPDDVPEFMQTLSI